MNPYLEKVTIPILAFMCLSSCSFKDQKHSLTKPLADEILEATMIYKYQPKEKDKFSVNGVRSEMSGEFVLVDVHSHIDQSNFTAFFIAYNDGRWIFHHWEDFNAPQGSCEYDPSRKDAQSNFWGRGYN